MAVETFRASVQYDDLKGTSSADRADQIDAREWLKEKGLVEDDEFLLGIDFYAGESDGVHKDPVYVRFFLVRSGNYEDVQAMLAEERGPIEVRRVSQDMSLADFFALFKRLSICLSSGGLLEGREIRYRE